MKKIIVRHIIIAFLFFIFIISMWCLFVYNFFDKELHRKINPAVEKSLSELSVAMNDNFEQNRIKILLSELEQNQDIVTFSLMNKNKNVHYVDGLHKRQDIVWMLSFVYPVKNDKEIIGWLEIWPSAELFIKTLADHNNVIVFVLSLFAVIFLIFIISYIYIRQNLIVPLNKIIKVINAIASGNTIDIDLLSEKTMWADVSSNIKKLNAKVIDVNSTMKMLFSATNIMTSDLEISHTVYLMFDIVQKKFDSTMCALFIPGDDGKLKISAKSGFSSKFIKGISATDNSPVWNCYENAIVTIIDNPFTLTKKEFGMFHNEGVVVQVNIPLTDDNNNCFGVFSVSGKDKNSFDVNITDTIATIAKYLATLMMHMRGYNKIKETNRKLETEVYTTSNELTHTNAILIKKIRDMKTIGDISAYASTRVDMRDIVNFIIDKIKDILSVEIAGIFLYDSEKSEFYTVSGSFEESDIIKFDKNQSKILNEIYETKVSKVFKNHESMYKEYEELKQYPFVNSAIFMPCISENGVVAVIMAINKIGDIAESDVKTFEHIAAIMACIVEKIKLYTALNTR